MSQRECFCFKFFHTKLRGPKFCHKGEAFIFNFFSQKLGDLLGDPNFVTTRRLSLFLFFHTKLTTIIASLINVIISRASPFHLSLEPDLCILCFRGHAQQGREPRKACFTKCCGYSAVIRHFFSSSRQTPNLDRKIPQQFVSNASFFFSSSKRHAGSSE